MLRASSTGLQYCRRFGYIYPRSFQITCLRDRICCSSSHLSTCFATFPIEKNAGPQPEQPDCRTAGIEAREGQVVEGPARLQYPRDIPLPPKKLAAQTADRVARWPGGDAGSTKLSEDYQTQQGTVVEDTQLYQHPRQIKSAGVDIRVLDGFQISPHHHIMATSSSVDDAWEAYQSLLTSDTALNGGDGVGDGSIVPLALQHRLARILASSKPRTRTLYLRLLYLLSNIRKSGGTVQLWEWNALIDYAGKGFRKIKLDDYKAAVRIFNDMLSCLEGDPDGKDVSRASSKVVQPDIITYTTLLHIAVRTLDPTALRHASSLLRSSQLLPSRITNLVLLRYRVKMDDLHGARDVVNSIVEGNQDVGIDGINTYLWAYAYAGRFDVAFGIYRALRQNVTQVLDTEADTNTGGRGTDPEIVEGLPISKEARPDEITYTLMIQTLTYRGYLIEALQVWTDMLTTPRELPRSGSHSAAGGDLSSDRAPYQPTLPIFRALFCGFARHGGMSLKLSEFSSRLHARQTPWHLENLDAIFNAFLELPPDVQPSERTIYWIMVAFGKTSKNDKKKLREIWRRLQVRFDGRWSGRLRRLAEMFAYDNKSKD